LKSSGAVNKKNYIIGTYRENNLKVEIMKCPKCNVSLLMSEKQGIEIDYCPDCRGIWLDRGELEKIVERSASPEYEGGNYFPRNEGSFEKHHDDHDNHNGPQGYKYGKRRNLLSELFD
jgi:Zn-finger nucleic acid-binding protein